MRSGSHRIKRQIMELDLPDRALAKTAQDRASRAHKKRLAPLIGRLCDQASPPGRIDRIDRIELDLGEIPLSDLEDELVARLAPALAKALAREIRANQRRMKRGRTVEIQSALELFAVFARTGRVPWWADARRAQLLESAGETLLRDAPHQLAALVAELASQPDAAKRIAIAFDDEWLAEVFGLLAPVQRLASGSEATPPRSSARFGAELVERVQSAAGALGVSPERLRTVAWQGALQVAARHRGNSFASLCKDVSIAVALHLKTTYRALVNHLRAAPEMDDARRYGPRSALSRIIEELDEQLPRRGRQARSQRGADSASASASESVSNSVSGPASEPASAPDANRPFAVSPFTTSDEIYVDNCGLVLLGPFLGHFFAEVGLLEDGRFRDRIAHHRAIGLLHHLVTESPAPVEYRLPLAKLLCGVDLAEPIEPGPPISPAEAGECERLLGAVIGHAPILGNLSTAGFRAAYLVRDGVLSERDGGWLLRVERETYDVVLDQLPWIVDWLELPWMPTLLRVEWISP